VPNLVYLPFLEKACNCNLLLLFSNILYFPHFRIFIRYSLLEL
jgi:hypothetical protein